MFDNIVDTSVSTSTPEEVAKWVQFLSEKLGVTLQCSEAIGTMLTNRIKHLRKVVKACKGGRQRNNILVKQWSFVNHRQDISFDAINMQKQNTELQERVAVLKDKVSRQANVMKKVLTNNTGRGQKRSREEYSERQKRRLRNQHADSCKMTLSWLEKEGYSPVKVNLYEAE